MACCSCARMIELQLTPPNSVVLFSAPLINSTQADIKCYNLVDCSFLMDIRKQKIRNTLQLVYSGDCASLLTINLSWCPSLSRTSTSTTSNNSFPKTATIFHLDMRVYNQWKKGCIQFGGPRRPIRVSSETYD